jgi:benzil reductase ((S)-benzoin forming)
MRKIVVITGANKGLGKAFLDIILQDKETVVLSLSRELHEEHKKAKYKNLFLVPTDLSQPFSEDSLKKLDEFVAEDCVLYFFNNAGSIVPIKSIGTFSIPEINNSIAVNINFPVHLVNNLIKRFPKQRMSIVNISSGAGKTPISYWSLYGSAKAYMALFFNILKEENDSNISVYNIDPGVLDTGMQKTIRENTFPKQSDFIALKSDQKLVDPADAAERILREVSF